MTNGREIRQTLRPGGRDGGRAKGRPRRLTVDQIVDAARAIGLEELTMSAVARRLDVSMAVLYGYISGREELVRLAAAQVTRESAFVPDRGQDWTVYVVESALALFALLTGPGQLIAHYLAGGLGPEVEVDRAEAWLEKMTASGFTVEEALLVQRQMGEIVIGGSVTALHARALDLAGRPFGDAALRAIAVREGATPLLASGRQDFASRNPVWHETLAALLRDLAGRRGECVDPDAIALIDSLGS